jgi:integrase
MKINSLHNSTASFSLEVLHKTPNGTYTMDSSNEDERTRSHLDTSCPEEAARRATYKKLDALNESIERRADLTIAELLKIYEWNRLPTGKQANDKTKRGNVVAMRRILERYGINPEENDIRYFARKYRGQPIPEHFAQFHSSNDVRLARSVFSKGWIRFYKEREGIDTSWFNNWVALSLNPVKVKPFEPLQVEENKIKEECRKLKSEDVELYKAYVLAYGLGLRSSEIQRAKFGDLRDNYGNKEIVIHNPKSGKAKDIRPCDPGWWDELMSYKTSDDDLIVCVQEDRITREFPKFLQDRCGVNDPRPVHRLRKYAGHRIMMLNQHNIFLAQKALGHSSPDITSKIYTGNPTIGRSDINS